MTGHIKLDRKILSWEWYNDANTFRVFVHLLLMATHKDGKYRGHNIKRGEIVTGRLKLATALRLSENEVRRSLFHLKSTNEITTRVTNRFSIITICKYDFYQSFKNPNDQQADQQINPQSTNNAPTVNQQLTTFNNVNNVKNVRDSVAPEKTDVERVFKQQGGTVEMAEKFYSNYSSIGWKLKGQPILDFSPLVGSFISTWHEIRDSQNGTVNKNQKIKLA